MDCGIFFLITVINPWLTRERERREGRELIPCKSFVLVLWLMWHGDFITVVSAGHYRSLRGPERDFKCSATQKERR